MTNSVGFTKNSFGFFSIRFNRKTEQVLTNFKTCVEIQGAMQTYIRETESDNKIGVGIEEDCRCKDF